MLAKINGMFLTMVLILSACGSSSGDSSKCTSKESCVKDSKCYCWCSVKCGYREKKPNDNPVWVEDDENGKYCYCKQWDVDHYEDNCINKKNMQEPKNAK